MAADTLFSAVGFHAPALNTTVLNTTVFNAPIFNEPVFYAPVGYSPWWPLAGIALLLLCLGWCAWVWISTRVGATASVPEFSAPRNPETVRHKYWALITDIEHRHDGGQLDGRSAHLELSLVLRTFVQEMTGLRAQRMTLAEPRAHQVSEHQLPLVADAVERWYPAQFGAGAGAVKGADAGTPSVASSAQQAREVVGQWR